MTTKERTPPERRPERTHHPRGELMERQQGGLRTELDRLFNDFRTSFDDIFWPWTSGGSMTGPSTRTPPMDVADRGDHYEIRTDMPGIPKENIDIEVTPTSIEVTGRYEEREEPQEGKGWVRRERQMDYYRGLELPEEVKTDAVNAQLRDGVLTIELPKASPQQSKTKRVAVK